MQAPIPVNFFQFESIIWSSSVSVLEANVAVWVLGDTSFRTDQRVSNISPSTIPAPGMNWGECRGKHRSM